LEDHSDLEAGLTCLLEEYPDLPVTADNFPLTTFAKALPEKELATLLLRMLHPFPEKRMTILEVLEDPWVQAIECCSPESNHSSTVRGDKAGDCGIPKIHDHRPLTDELASNSDYGLQQRRILLVLGSWKFEGLYNDII
jgi:hypothetical protein